MVCGQLTIGFDSRISTLTKTLIEMKKISNIVEPLAVVASVITLPNEYAGFGIHDIVFFVVLALSLLAIRIAHGIDRASEKE